MYIPVFHIRSDNNNHYTKRYYRYYHGRYEKYYSFFISIEIKPNCLILAGLQRSVYKELAG